MPRFTDLYGDIEYPDPGYPAVIDPRTAAARRRAATLRQATLPSAPLTVSPDDEEFPPLDEEIPDEETDYANQPPPAKSPSMDLSAVYGAGSEDPVKAAAMVRAKMLMEGEAPQGRQAGRVYVAPSMLETLAYGAQYLKGAHQLRKATAPGADRHVAGAQQAQGLPEDQRANALLMSNDPALQRAGAALLAQQRADASLASRTEAERLRRINAIDLESARQGGRESLAKLRASLKGPTVGPRPSYTVAVGPQGAYRVERTTGAVSRVDLPAGPPPGAAPGSPEVKAAENLVLDKLPADVRTKYSVYDWQTTNLPNIMERVQSAPPNTFGPGSDMASFVPGQSFSAIVRTWQDKGRTPEQVEARRAVFSDAYAKIKEMAGTAMTETESNRLREFLPNGNDTPENIVAKLRGAQEEALRQKALVRDRYLPGFPDTAAPAPGAAGSAPAPVGAAGPTQIKTRADYDALPSGTTYVDPNGVTRTKR